MVLALTSLLSTTFAEVGNNFLKHAQVATLKKELDDCAKKAGGCKDGEADTIIKNYVDLSAKNIATVENCIFAGNTTCVKNELAQAATVSETKNILPMGFGSIERILVTRQDNIASFGSVYGAYSRYGTDLDQANEIARFRQSNCAALSAGSCDRLVSDAIRDRAERTIILNAVGMVAAGATNALRTLRLPTNSATSTGVKVIRGTTTESGPVVISPEQMTVIIKGVEYGFNTKTGLYDIKLQTTGGGTSVVTTGGSVAAKGGAVVGDADLPLSYTPKGEGVVGSVASTQTLLAIESGIPVSTVQMPVVLPNKIPASPVDIDHAIGADYSKAGKPTGGHSLLNGDVQIVPGSESIPDVFGVYKATIQVPDLKNPGQWVTKTSNESTNSMFPKNWDLVRIRFEVDGAWNSPNKIVDGSKWSSFTPSGVKVEGFISPRITVYPVYQSSNKGKL